MNAEEYDRMSALEASHWWYLGVRDLFSRLLQRPRFRLPPGPRVLDAGCGSGGNLQLLGDLLKPAYLGGFDLSEKAVAYAAGKNPDADVYQSDLCCPEVHVDHLNLVFSCDVLYTTPLPEAIAGLKTLCDRLEPNGLLILHLPAYNWLASGHDLAVHTRQRFTVSRARAILAEVGLQEELLTYRMFLLFPAVVLRRLPSVLRRKWAGSEQASSDVQPAGAFLNRVLTFLLKLENRALVCGVRFPWGSSLVAVGRKP